MSAWYWIGLVVALGYFAAVVADARRLHRRGAL